MFTFLKVISQINWFSSRPKMEDAWVFAKPNAIQAVGVMSFGEYVASKGPLPIKSHLFTEKELFHIYAWISGILSFKLPVSSI